MGPGENGAVPNAEVTESGAGPIPAHGPAANPALGGLFRTIMSWSIATDSAVHTALKSTLAAHVWEHRDHFLGHYRKKRTSLHFLWIPPRTTRNGRIRRVPPTTCFLKHC